MVITDTIEGVVDGSMWFHYDLANDVLYMRLASRREASAVGEETPDGVVLLRDAETGEPVGLTVVNWWKRFGQGQLPDSITELQRLIEPWAKRVAA
ncbi:MAG: DUF2283 domain-containing protein [Phycisphaerae bacterium]